MSGCPTVSLRKQHPIAIIGILGPIGTGQAIERIIGVAVLTIVAQVDASTWLAAFSNELM